MSNNDIRKLENFPQLRRLRMLLLNNNRVSRIAPDLANSLAHLDTLILTNNQVRASFLIFAVCAGLTRSPVR